VYEACKQLGDRVVEGDDGEMNHDCKNCEAMKVLLRLQFNLRKKDSSVVSEALDAAINDSLYVPDGY